MTDHVLINALVPPKDSLSQVTGLMKWTVRSILLVCMPVEKKPAWAELWACEYWVSTMEKNEASVRRYIQEQVMKEKGPESAGDLKS